jgi:hypothetical protein
VRVLAKRQEPRVSLQFSVKIDYGHENKEKGGMTAIILPIAVALIEATVSIVVALLTK